MVQISSSTRGLAISTASIKARNKASSSSTRTSSSPSTARSKRGPELKWNELIISIDYGTTFLSAAYLYIDGNKPEPKLSLSLPDLSGRIGVITDNWPGSDSESTTVPTEILYADLGSSSDPRVWFGHEVNEAFENKEAPVQAKHVRLAKLLLHNAKETESENKRLQELAQESGKDEFDFVKEFLIFVRESIVKYFKEHHSSWLSRTKVKFVIGCPPAWSMSEHRKMAQIATEAKMPPLFMGSEAEAQLAVYLAECDKSSLEVDDAVVICDAGGGTVDLVTVIIRNLDPLEIVHACVSEGATCGGIYIDRRMSNLFVEKLGPENLEDFDEIMEELMKRFVHSTKKRFTGQKDCMFEVRGLKEDSSRGFRQGRLIIAGEEMRKAVFDPSVDELVSKVRKQITMSRNLHEDIKIKTLTLSGGLGANSYVFSRLTAALAEWGEDIEIQKMPNPGGANVAKGLILLASDQKLIKQRRCRLNYGLLTYEAFDEKIHGSEKETRPEEKYNLGDEPVVKLIDWFLVKGQPIKEKFSIHRKGRNFGVLPDDTTVEDELYIYDGDLPEHMVDTKYTLHRDLPNDAEICTIQADISELEKDEIFTENISLKTGLPYYSIDYDFVARHQDLDRDSIACSLSLMSKDGYRLRNIKTTTLNMGLVATEKEDDETVLLGSLVSRAEAGSHIPQSEFGRGPLFPDRKRGSEEFEEDGDEKSDENVESASRQPVQKAARRVW